jgi:hypothetical protein
VSLETADPIPTWKRLLLFARVPLALGAAVGLAQGSELFTLRDAALLGGSTPASPAPWAVSLTIVLIAAVLPGAAILVQGLQRGILFSIAGLVLYLVVSVLTHTHLGVALPLLAPVGAWYLSQVLGIGWRPHSQQNVRHLLPADQRGVFISYRRSLDEVTARMFKQELAARGFDVFLDVDNLGPSARFDQRLLEEIRSRYNFVLLLSPGSLDRCHEENDWLRLELEHALATGRRVVPVTRAGFQLRDSDRLPAGITALPMHNAIAYSSTHHTSVIGQLVGFLCTPRTAAA